MKDTTVCMNLPLLIRIMELVREDVKSDADLHRVVENILSVADDHTLTMADYDTIADISRKGMGVYRRKKTTLKFRK